MEEAAEEARTWSVFRTLEGVTSKRRGFVSETWRNLGRGCEVVTCGTDVGTCVGMTNLREHHYTIT